MGTRIRSTKHETCRYSQGGHQSFGRGEFGSLSSDKWLRATDDASEATSETSEKFVIMPTNRPDTRTDLT